MDHPLALFMAAFLGERKLHERSAAPPALPFLETGPVDLGQRHCAGGFFVRDVFGEHECQRQPARSFCRRFYCRRARYHPGISARTGARHSRLEVQAMTDKVRPYLFYDVVVSICSTCFQKIEAKTVFQDGKVYMLKRCPQHGHERVLIADDVDYYRRSREVFIKPPEMPLVYNTPVRWGCPYDCGLCSDHEQHSCLTLVEICDYCNLRCPVCYASSGPERQQFRDLRQVEKMLDAVVRNEGHPDVVQLSGGEPTMHPNFFEIVEMAKARPIRHLMVNTNGVRIAQEEDFVKRLADYREDFEVYLQFDSFEREPLMQLRGADLRRIREDALEKLNRYNIHTNLVVTLKKGLNDHEIGKTIDYALQQPCVRGVTFQPIQDAGRLESWVPDRVATDAFVRPAEQGDASSNSDADVLSNPTTGNKSGTFVRNFNPATDRLTLTEVR